MSSLDRLVETVSVHVLVGRLLDAVRELNEEAAKQLPTDWVAENGPYAPLEQLKEGMITVHREWQDLQREWRALLDMLQSKKADTGDVEKALVMLAAAAAKMALDMQAAAIRNRAIPVAESEEPVLAAAE